MKLLITSYLAAIIDDTIVCLAAFRIRMYENKLVALAHDLGMIARNGWYVDDDVVIGSATNRRDRFFEFIAMMLVVGIIAPQVTFVVGIRPSGKERPYLIHHDDGVDGIIGYG